MLGFPPRPSSIIPRIDNWTEWLVQPKYWGWRVVIYNNKVYTRHGNLLNINTHYRTDFEYQLDGELMSEDGSGEHKVRTAIKNGRWKIHLFDVYIPDSPELSIVSRIKIVAADFDPKCELRILKSEDDFRRLYNQFKAEGFEGAIIKKLDGIYQISKNVELVAHDWIKFK